MKDPSGVVRRVSAAEAPLQDGEVIVLEANLGFPPSMMLVAVIVAFVPPLFVVFSALLVGGVILANRTQRVVLTDRRLIFRRRNLVRNHLSTEIDLVNLSNVRAKDSGGLTGLIDRMLGVGDLNVHVNGEVIAAMTIPDVRRPGEFAKAVNERLALSRG